MRKRWLVVFFVNVLLAGAGSASTSRALLTDVRYPEGPLWRNGQLLFAEMGGDRVTAWDGTKTSLFWRERGCGPTAIVPFRESDLVILCHLGGYLVQVDASGSKIGRFKKDDSGKRLHDPNDATPDGEGGLYFSDAGVFRKSAPATGAIFHVDRNGKIRRVADHLHYANGVFFDAHARQLYVSEHLARRVLIFDVADDGALANKRVFVDLDRDGPSMRSQYVESGPDGLELDDEGVLWVCEYGQGRVLAVDRKGRVRGQVLLATTYLTNIAISADSRVALTGAFSNVSFPFRGEVRVLPLSMLKQSAALSSGMK